MTPSVGNPGIRNPGFFAAFSSIRGVGIGKYLSPPDPDLSEILKKSRQVVKPAGGKAIQIMQSRGSSRTDPQGGPTESR